MPPAPLQHSNKQPVNHFHYSLAWRGAGLAFLALLLMGTTHGPHGIAQGLATSTLAASMTASIGSPTPSATSTATAISPTPAITPTASAVAPTPKPTKIRPTATQPVLPPASEIGSTSGIIGLGIVIVAIILGTLLWHRQDWAPRRAPREKKSGRT